LVPLLPRAHLTLERVIFSQNTFIYSFSKDSSLTINANNPELQLLFMFTASMERFSILQTRKWSMKNLKNHDKVQNGLKPFHLRS
jgi:hypothetical protein